MEWRSKQPEPSLKGGLCQQKQGRCFPPSEGGSWRLLPSGAAVLPGVGDGGAQGLPGCKNPAPWTSWESKKASTTFWVLTLETQLKDTRGLWVRPYQPPPVQKCSHKNNSRLCELTAVARQGRDLALSDCTLLCCMEIWCLNVSRSIWKHLPGGTCPKFKGLALKVEQNHVGNPGEGSGETLLQTGQRWQEAPWAGLLSVLFSSLVHVDLSRRTGAVPRLRVP